MWDVVLRVVAQLLNLLSRCSNHADHQVEVHHKEPLSLQEAARLPLLLRFNKRLLLPSVEDYQQGLRQEVHLEAHHQPLYLLLRFNKRLLLPSVEDYQQGHRQEVHLEAHHQRLLLRFNKRLLLP